MKRQNLGTNELITIENLPNSTRDLNRDLKTASLDMVQRIDRAIPKLGLMSNGPHFAPLMERSMKKPDVCENCA